MINQSCKLLAIKRLQLIYERPICSIVNDRWCDEAFSKVPCVFIRITHSSDAWFGSAAVEIKRSELSRSMYAFVFGLINLTISSINFDHSFPTDVRIQHIFELVDFVFWSVIIIAEIENRYSHVSGSISINASHCRKQVYDMRLLLLLMQERCATVTAVKDK